MSLDLSDQEKVAWAFDAFRRQSERLDKVMDDLERVTIDVRTASRAVPQETHHLIQNILGRDMRKIAHDTIRPLDESARMLGHQIQRNAEKLSAEAGWSRVWSHLVAFFSGIVIMGLADWMK